MRLAFFLSLATAIVFIVCPGMTRAGLINLNTTIDSALNEGILVVDGNDPPTVVNVVAGAEITFGLLQDTSITNIHGGSFYLEDFDAGSPAIISQDQSVLNIFGGRIEAPISNQAISARDDSTLNIHAGEIFGETDSIVASDRSTVNIYGSSFTEPIVALDSSTLNIYGGQFLSSQFTAVSLGQNAILNVFGRELEFEGSELSGILADGTLITASLFVGNDAQVALHTIPEPSTQMQFAVALFCFLLFVNRRNYLLLRASKMLSK